MGMGQVVQLNAPRVGSFAHGDEPPRILIGMLDRFRLFKTGRHVNVRSGGKIEGVLCILALNHDRSIARDMLLSALWPNSSTALASQSLNSLIYSLHRLLGDVIGGEPPIVRADNSYRLNLEAGVGVDITQFDALACKGKWLERAGDLRAAARCYEQAVRLYRGDLWPGADVYADIQATIERERLRATYLSALARLASFHYEQKDYDACLDYSQHLLAHDPYREDGHRLVMLCHVQRGERAQALRQYRVCERLLQEEFDAEPEPATQALYEQIRLHPDSI